MERHRRSANAAITLDPYQTPGTIGTVKEDYSSTCTMPWKDLTLVGGTRRLRPRSHNSCCETAQRASMAKQNLVVCHQIDPLPKIC
jgi:hypothetical protein